jgi:hypothetical protein
MRPASIADMIWDTTMVAIRTRFDGQTIEVPAELRGSRPGEVIVIFEPGVKQAHSLWDVIGKSKAPRSAAELDAQIREERESWPER